MYCLCFSVIQSFSNDGKSKAIIRKVKKKEKEVFYLEVCIDRAVGPAHTVHVVDPVPAKLVGPRGIPPKFLNLGCQRYNFVHF